MSNLSGAARGQSLRAERDFLLRSLDDLDAEFRVGDIADDEYQTLLDSYTARAAQVERRLRAVEAGEVGGVAAGSAPERLRSSWRRRFATMIAVGAVMAVAGVLLAQAIGFRSPSGELTGGIRQSTAGLLNEADALSREGRWEEALDRYDEIIDEDPSNAEALTYSGWIRFTQFGEQESGSDLIAEAIAVAPDYPDARVFGALTARSRQDWNEARTHLTVLDGLGELPAQVDQLVTASDLRGQVAAGLVAEEFAETGQVDLATIRLEPDDVARGALRLDANGEFLAALTAFEAVLVAEPDNRNALVGMGRRLAATPNIGAESPETAARGLALLDRAVTNDPDDVEALTFRALGRALGGDTAGAAADLVRIDDLPVPDELVEIVEGIRSALS